VESHRECEFCNIIFKEMEPKQIMSHKRRVIKQGLNHVDNKEEEYFRMSLLSL